MKQWLIRCLLYMQLYAGKLQLFAYAFLIEMLLGIGDVAFILIYPELFIAILLFSVVMLFWKKLRVYIPRVILKRQMLLTPTLCLFSCMIFLQYCVWVQPY